MNDLPLLFEQISIPIRDWMKAHIVLAWTGTLSHPCTIEMVGRSLMHPKLALLLKKVKKPVFYVLYL